MRSMGEMVHLKLQPVRESSTPSASSPTTLILSPAILSPKKQRPKAIKSIWDRLIFPYTSEDWKIIMDEIKKLYSTRQYKQCTARCKTTLDSITDPYRVHPLYSLFLSFYCATCLEITASKLHNNSPQKLSLLQESLSYFRKTEEYITYADIPIESNDLTLGNRCSSISSTSSLRSSVDSIFSTSFPSTADGLLPAFSSSSFDNDEDYYDQKSLVRRRTFSESSVASTQSTQSADTTAPLRFKKKVSFSPVSPTLISTQDLVNNSSIIESIPPAIQSPITPLRPIISSKYQSPSPAHSSLNTHLTNYNLNLSSLTTQLNYHITHVNKLIDAIQNLRKSRRSNQPSFAPSLFDSSGDLNEDRENIKRKEIRERIEKLRSAGWERKRWDGSRYEALREKVENELNGWI